MNTTASTGAVPTPSAAPRSAGLSVSASRAQMDFGALMQAYSALPMLAKVGWKDVADTLNAQQGRVGRKRLSPGNAYCILGSGNLAAGQDLPTEAPANINPPSRMPPLTLSATSFGTAEDGAETFSLILSSSVAYAHFVQVLAAAPNPGKTTYPDTDFAPIEVMGSILVADYDLAHAYALRYGTPELGAQIALKLVAISAAGVRLPPLLLCATVTAPAASAAGSGDSKLQQAA